MRRFFLAVLLVVTCASGAAAGSIEDAASAYDRGDFSLAERLLRPLAEQGMATAQYNLGMMYDGGQGVPQDDQVALKWYRKAAEQGVATAQFNLGVMYANGRGVPRDAQESVKWYRKAAEQGDAQAQFNLGLMYSNGQGVPQDFIRAHVWYSVAAAALSGDEGKMAIKFRDRAASRMTAAQIGQAQEMARRYQQPHLMECD